MYTCANSYYHLCICSSNCNEMSANTHVYLETSIPPAHTLLVTSLSGICRETTLQLESHSKVAMKMNKNICKGAQSIYALKEHRINKRKKPVLKSQP